MSFGSGPDARQKSVIDSIVSILETGKLPGPDAYRSCTILPDGAGISYGKHQATDKSGACDAIMMEYVSEGGEYAAELRPFLPLVAGDLSTRVDPSDPPPEVRDLVAVLRKCGRDPVMQRVQDKVFDLLYWQPTLAAGRDIRLELPLSYLLIYDTAIQSGVGAIWAMRKLFRALPPSRGGKEVDWASAYASARLRWIAGFESADARKQETVRRTSYRVEAITRLIAEGNWTLSTPLQFRGIEVP